MNAAELKRFVKTAAGESAQQQVEDYLEGNFMPMGDTDEKLKSIMENTTIRDKDGAFADVLWNDKGFLSDFLDDAIYSAHRENVKQSKVLTDGLIKLSPHDLWTEVVNQMKGELKID